MVSQGRIDVLLVVAGLPFIVRRLFELMDVQAGFRTTALHASRWRSVIVDEARTTLSRPARMVAVMLIAILTAMAPATLVAVTLIILGVFLARLFETDEGVNTSGPWRFLGSIWLNVAVLLLPLTIDVGLAGGRATSGCLRTLARGPWSVPSFANLLRAADGGFGLSWAGWLLPGAALVGLILCRGGRCQVSPQKSGVDRDLDAGGVAALDARHWMGSFAPDLDVLFALYVGRMLALLIGSPGSARSRTTCARPGLDGVRSAPAVTVAALIVAVVPFAAIFASGRFDLPTTSVAEVVEHGGPVDGRGYRVLLVG